MAKLHVIWDPKGQIQPQPMPDHVKVAVMDVQDDIEGEDLNEIVDTLVHTLLEQWT